MQQKRIISEDLRSLRMKLEEDAEKAKEVSEESLNQDWIDSEYWSQYMSHEGRKLYKSFSDEELLNILRNTAKELGRAPYQKDIFCVYRAYIRRRFTNWPRALYAAGLKEHKKHKDNDKTKEENE